VRRLDTLVHTNDQHEGTLMSSINPAPTMPSAAQMFAQLDTNGDQQISAAEFAAAPAPPPRGTGFDHLGGCHGADPASRFADAATQAQAPQTADGGGGTTSDTQDTIVTLQQQVATLTQQVQSLVDALTGGSAVATDTATST
jgi:hypothetical protein